MTFLYSSYPDCVHLLIEQDGMSVDLHLDPTESSALYETMAHAIQESRAYELIEDALRNVPDRTF